MAKMKTDETEALPYSYVMELYESYQALSERCLEVKAAIREDAGKYPIYIPTYGKDEKAHTSNEAREAAIKSIIQLFVLDDTESVPGAGIVCASPKTVESVDSLNKAKKAFKKAVMAIRNFQKEKDVAVSRINKLIRDEILEKGFRNEALKQAMATVRISSLDLKRCYSRIRIMPAELDVFSWTWTTNHSRLKKFAVTEAIEMAKKLPNKEESEVALALLSSCGPGETLVKKVKLSNQLRANYAYFEDGEITRKSGPISGVVIAQQQNMPRKKWRSDPGENSNRVSRESSINESIFIKALGLHRYAK